MNYKWVILSKLSHFKNLLLKMQVCRVFCGLSENHKIIEIEQAKLKLYEFKVLAHTYSNSHRLRPAQENSINYRKLTKIFKHKFLRYTSFSSHIHTSHTHPPHTEPSKNRCIQRGAPDSDRGTITLPSSLHPLINTLLQCR